MKNENIDLDDGLARDNRIVVSVRIVLPQATRVQGLQGYQNF
jgi:hypothetical protein